MVVTVGLTDGFDIVELKPEGELTQAYVLPDTLTLPIEADKPEQMVEFAETDAEGSALTLILSFAVSFMEFESAGLFVHVLIVKFPAPKLNVPMVAFVELPGEIVPDQLYGV